MNDYNDINDVSRVLGIPIEWFWEIDAACEAFFKRRRMKPLLSVRQQITRDRRLREHENEARERNY